MAMLVSQTVMPHRAHIFKDWETTEV